MRLAGLHTLILLLTFALPWPARGAGEPSPSPFPGAAGGWKAASVQTAFDRTTVYDELDGGAEVYLDYGLQSLRVQKYAKEGAPEITFDLFEMDDPAGAYGAFTFEREDEEVGVGQGSEYGGGLLRFWKGRFFGFVQAEKETPASKAAVLELGRSVAARLGPPGKEPAIVRALPTEDRRPRSLRLARSPLLLGILEPRMQGNPLGLPARCEAVVARYGAKGSPERILVARFPDPASAQKGLGQFLDARFPLGAKPAEAVKEASGYAAATALRSFVIVVIAAPEPLAALKKLESTMHRVEEVTP